MKRCLDLSISITLLVLFMPLFLFVSLIIKFETPGPIFFRQDRVGRYGKIFQIHKFRTMINDFEINSSEITIGEDPRITKFGFYLRKYKIDELPQLIDVLIGNMSLVGPRPEVPRYVDLYPEISKSIIFSVRPGITDMASIYFRNESLILASSSDPIKTYVEEILPIKISYYTKYVESNSIIGDVIILIRTVFVILS